MPDVPILNYVTEEEVKSASSLTGTSFADSEVSAAVAAASRGIDAYCERRFWLDVEAATRKYTPESDIVQIDDLTREGEDEIVAELAGVELVEGTDYVLEPLNAAADGKPYEQVRLLVAVDRTPGTFAITGLFGWPSVPTNVSISALILAQRYLVRMRQAPLGIVTVGIEQGAIMRVSEADPDVVGLLRNLQRTRYIRSYQLG